MSELRTIKVDGQTVRMSELKPGDRFEMYESDNTYMGLFQATASPETINGVCGVKAVYVDSAAQETLGK